MRMQFVVSVALLLGACASAGEPVGSQPACVRLRDHLVDLRLADATGVDRDAHAAAMRVALGDGFVSQCESKLTERQRACALNAITSAVARACVAN